MPERRSVPRAPNGLQRRGKLLWSQLHTVFDFTSEPHRLVLIEDACREADLVDRLQRAVDKNDLRVKGSQHQPVTAPEVSELRLHRKTLADILRALSLPDDGTD
jgi:hypothetical protein